MCGHGVDDRQQQQERAEYQRAVASARSHISVGNWQTAISLLSPLMQNNPTDTTLYSLTLRAATRDYTDFDMEASSLRSTAHNCWDKLTRLGGIDGNMIRYSSLVWQAKRNALKKKKNKVYVRTALTVGSFLGAFACLSANSYFAFILLVIVSICFAGSISDLKPKEIDAEISRLPDNSRANPF